MIDHLQMASSLMKRAAEGGQENYDLPPWAFGIVMLSCVVFLPFFIFVGYTMRTLYPTLAIVEDPNPPAYEPLPLNEDADGEAVTPAMAPVDAKATTSSLRAINRLLYSVGGWKGNFRGIICALAISVAMGFAGGIFAAIPFIPSFTGTLLASLALVQLETAWVHIVVSNPSKLPFYKRLPPFRKTFEATCIPVFVFWLARTIMGGVPVLIAGALNFPIWQPKDGSKVPKYDHTTTWKVAIILLVTFAIYIFLVIPAQVVLVRVQASLLPPDEDPIVPFDRSFEGTVEPVIVGGNGYVTWRDALKTFPRASWIRLYVLYVKVFLVSMALYVLFAAVLLPEVILLSRKSEKAN